MAACELPGFLGSHLFFVVEMKVLACPGPGFFLTCVLWITELSEEGVGRGCLGGRPWKPQGRAAGPGVVPQGETWGWAASTVPGICPVADIPWRDGVSASHSDRGTVTRQAACCAATRGRFLRGRVWGPHMPPHGLQVRCGVHWVSAPAQPSSLMPTAQPSLSCLWLPKCVTPVHASVPLSTLCISPGCCHLQLK